MSDVTATINFIDTNYNLLHTLQICWSSVGECSGGGGGGRRGGGGEEEGDREARKEWRKREEEEGERRRGEEGRIVKGKDVFLGTNLGHVSAYFVNS